MSQEYSQAGFKDGAEVCPTIRLNRRFREIAALPPVPYSLLYEHC